MLSMSQAVWRAQFGGPGFHGQVPEPVSGGGGVLRTWNGGIGNAIDLKVLEKLSCSALATSHQRRQVTDENLTPTRMGEGLSISSIDVGGAPPTSMALRQPAPPARSREGGAGALITAFGFGSLIVK